MSTQTETSDKRCSIFMRREGCRHDFGAGRGNGRDGDGRAAAAAAADGRRADRAADRERRAAGGRTIAIR